MSKNTPNWLIAAGGNLHSVAGCPAVTLSLAVRALADYGFVIRSVSRFFRTPCFPAGAGPDYVNAALIAARDGDAEEILDCLHQVEGRFDRERTGRWASRTLDLDLLGQGDQIRPDPDTFRRWCAIPDEEQRRVAPDELILPHPRLHERPFVLLPLRDIAADWQHPVLGQSVSQLCDGLDPEQCAEVVPL